VYGCAVLKCWGKPGALDTLRKLARETYYDQRPLAQIAKTEDDHRSEQKSARAARFDERNEEKVEGEGEQKMDVDMMDILNLDVSSAPIGVRSATDTAGSESGRGQRDEGSGMVASTVKWLFYVCFS
jgi:hypothetical protein